MEHQNFPHIINAWRYLWAFESATLVAIERLKNSSVGRTAILDSLVRGGRAANSLSNYFLDRDFWTRMAQDCFPDQENTLLFACQASSRRPLSVRLCLQVPNIRLHVGCNIYASVAAALYA
jgi:hypothetical protein